VRVKVQPICTIAMESCCRCRLAIRRPQPNPARTNVLRSPSYHDQNPKEWEATSGARIRSYARPTPGVDLGVCPGPVAQIKPTRQAQLDECTTPLPALCKHLIATDGLQRLMYLGAQEPAGATPPAHARPAAGACESRPQGLAFHLPRRHPVLVQHTSAALRGRLECLPHQRAASRLRSPWPAASRGSAAAPACSRALLPASARRFTCTGS
jgi:hypothetical protein